MRSKRATTDAATRTAIDSNARVRRRGDEARGIRPICGAARVMRPGPRGDVARGRFAAGGDGPTSNSPLRQPQNTTLRLAYGESAARGAGRFADACAEFEQLKGRGLGARDLGLPAARACLRKGEPDAAIRVAPHHPAIDSCRRLFGRIRPLRRCSIALTSRRSLRLVSEQRFV
jgi:hypothetical protein